MPQRAAWGNNPCVPGEATDLTEAHVDRIFAAFVQDISEFAVALHGQPSANPEQQEGAPAMIARPTPMADAEDTFVAEVPSYDGASTMNP